MDRPPDRLRRVGRTDPPGGIVASEPGLYFVGLSFQTAASSGLLLGVGRDAERIADEIRARVTRR